jgi:hypothetical protein
MHDATDSPFPPRISPYAEDAERAVRRFLRRSGLFRSTQTAGYYRTSRLGYLTAQIYPDAIRDRLLPVARWYGVWTMFDDQLEQLPDHRSPAGVDLVAGHMMSWVQPGTDGHAGDGGPFGHAFRGVWTQIAARSPSRWRARFHGHLREYLSGCRWEAENRHTGAVPDLATYIDRRRRFGGIRAAMDLSEFAGGYVLPEAVYRHPVVQEMLDVLGDLTLWGNDLFSVAVDAEEGNVSNLLFVLCEQLGCDLEQAASTAKGMLEERLRRLATLHNELRDWYGDRWDARTQEDVERYVEGMHTWISGNLAWSTGNTRYLSARHRVHGGQPNFLLALVPADFTDAPQEPSAGYSVGS